MPKAMVAGGWTEAAKALAIRLYTEGRSAREVADALAEQRHGDWTRNAVIGLLQRCGVKRPPATLAETHRVENKLRPRASAPARRNAAAAESVKRPLPPSTEREQFAGGPVISGARAAYAHDDKGCAWIHGDPLQPDRLYCNAPYAENGPWCAAHHARANRPVKR